MTPIRHRWLLELGTGTQVVRFPPGVSLFVCVLKTEGEKESVAVINTCMFVFTTHQIIWSLDVLSVGAVWFMDWWMFGCVCIDWGSLSESKEDLDGTCSIWLQSSSYISLFILRSVTNMVSYRFEKLQLMTPKCHVGWPLRKKKNYFPYTLNICVYSS